MRGFPKSAEYVNLETMEILTYRQMIQEAEERYDFDEFTPASELWNYYCLLSELDEMTA